MGLWRHHDDDDNMGGGGVLGALFFMLGLYLFASMFQAHADATRERELQAAARGEDPDHGLGWWTLGILVAIVALLVSVT